MANFMKSKIFLSVLFLGLAAFVIGGVTMAWFTDDANLEAAEFHAGTVEINADGTADIEVPEGKSFNNMNPGDCATVIWEFENTGTEAVQLKVNLTKEWSDPELSNDSVFYCPVDMDPAEPKGWVMADDDNEDIWLYYIDKHTGNPGFVPGTPDPNDPEKVELKLVVVFDKDTIDNPYQGETFTLGGDGSKVYAIQASNQAPDNQWDDWSNIIGAGLPNSETYKTTDPNSWKNWEYFHGGLGTNSDCWRYHLGLEPIDPAKLYVTISYLPNGVHYQEWEQWDEGDDVSLTAPDIDDYDFVGWRGVPGQSGLVTSKTIEFVMPDHNVGVTAEYEAEVAPAEFNVQLTADKSGSKTWVGAKINNLKINGVLVHNQWVNVAFEVTHGSNTGSNTIPIYFWNGNSASLIGGWYGLHVAGASTNNDNNVTAIINGVRKNNNS